MKSISLFNPRNNIHIKASVANTFFTKLRGLMFQKEIQPNSGLILSENSESILNTSIHMLFMNFNITAVWINKEWQVVDKCLAKKWHLAYISHLPALHVLELHSSQFENFTIGDQLEIQID
jgi:uncharacterized protein